jgi:hypothetical protein
MENIYPTGTVFFIQYRKNVSSREKISSRENIYLLRKIFIDKGWAIR